MRSSVALALLSLGLVGLGGDAYAEPTGAASGAIEFCGQSLDLKTTEVKCDLWDVTDPSPLSGLTGLTKLNLQDSRVSDLSSLSGLTGLTELNLKETRVRDLSPLSGLTGLTVLNLEGTYVRDLGSPSHLTSENEERLYWIERH